MFIVPEGEVDEEGLLPSSTVREIRAWLGSLAADAWPRLANSKTARMRTEMILVARRMSKF